MDGLTLLKKLTKYCPMSLVMVVSALNEKCRKLGMEACSLGAVEFMAKPGGSFSVRDMAVQSDDKVRAVAMAKEHKSITEAFNSTRFWETNLSKSLQKPTNKIMALGASTRGLGPRL